VLPTDTRLISVDDHVVEPAHVFAEHIAPAFRDRAPRIVEHDGQEGWLWEDRFYPLSLQGNPYTRKFRDGEAGRGDDLYARGYADMIDAVYDVHARVEAMDRDGVWAALQFPTFPRFAGTLFLEAVDRDLALACVRAWNDWMLDEWWAAYPDRFIPQSILPLWDVPAAVAEMERVAAKGARAISFVENPHPLGLPSFATGHWRPVFEASASIGIPLSMHIGTSSGLLRPSPESTNACGVALCGVNSMSALVDIVYSGMCNGLPGLKIALSEGGAGWIPYVLERMDYTWHRSRYEGLANDRLPSDVFRDHFWTCIIADEYALRNRDLIGVDKIMWECDFPHNDSNFPNSRKLLAEFLVDVPDDEARMIGETNARALYDFPA